MGSFSLGDIFEGRQGIGPEALQIGAQGRQARGIHAVEMSGSVLALGHETRSLQDPEVLGHRRPRDREIGGDVHHRSRTLPQQFKHGPSRGVAQRVQDLSGAR